MTIEEIKAEIKSRQYSCIKMVNGGCDNTAYVRGSHDTYREVLELLEDLEPSWHPYPKEVPLVSDVYRVTLDVSPFAITRDLYYNSVTGLCQLPRGGGELSVDVIAWMELPKPYKKENA